MVFQDYQRLVTKNDTHGLNYKMETTPNKYEIDELPGGMFLITFEWFIPTNEKKLDL